jgi:DoxX-like family
MMSASALELETARPNRWKRWLVLVGWLIGGLGVLIVLASVRWKLVQAPFYVREWKRIGYPVSDLKSVGVVLLACVTLYLIPRTAVLGTVLLTGYLGGAIASYVRIGEPFPFPLVTCLLLWVGIYLREERLRALLPFRR